MQSAHLLSAVSISSLEALNTVDDHGCTPDSVFTHNMAYLSTTGSVSGPAIHTHAVLTDLAWLV